MNRGSLPTATAKVLPAGSLNILAPTWTPLKTASGARSEPEENLESPETSFLGTMPFIAPFWRTAAQS